MRKLLTILFIFPLVTSAQFPPLPSTLGFNKPQSNVTTYLYDTFTGTDGTSLPSHTMNVGGGWTARQNGLCGSVSQFTIQSNKAQPPLAILGLVTADATVSDYVVSLDLSVPNQNNYLGGIAFRWVDCANYWAAFIERDAAGTPYMAIMESNGGTRSYRATVNVTGATNTTLNIKVTLSGNSIVALAGTGETCNYTSSSFATSTQVGVIGYNDGTTYSPAINVDNFLVTNM